MANVLIVDDDADIRASIRTLLEELGGHTVREAVDGLDALNTLRGSEDRMVVLLDLLMPKLDGIGMLRAVASDERLATRNAYVLVSVSRQATSADFLASLNFPVSVVSKPFDISILLATVDAASQQLL